MHVLERRETAQEISLLLLPQIKHLHVRQNKWHMLVVAPFTTPHSSLLPALAAPRQLVQVVVTRMTQI